MTSPLAFSRDAVPGVRPRERRAPARPFVLLLVLFLLPVLRAAEQLPPAPENHFNDYARVVRPETARELDARLAAFERETSNQILVAIYPRMASASSVEDYTLRALESWNKGVGIRGRDNGAVLFAFIEQRQLYLQVGYGLEGALPDALAKRIIEDEIVPHLRRGDPDSAFRAGVESMLAATRGEYRGSARTLREGQPGAVGPGGGGGGFIVLIVFIAVISSIFRERGGGQVYSPRGRRSVWAGPGPFLGGGSRGFGGGGRSFGGGGFSGGGGRFGGGGAGGRW